MSWRALAPRRELLNSRALLQVADDIVHAASVTVSGRRHITPTMVHPQEDGSITWVADCRMLDEDVRSSVLNRMASHKKRTGVERKLPTPEDMRDIWFEQGCNFDPFPKKLSRGLFGIVRQILPGAKEIAAAGGSDACHLAGLRVEVIDGAGPDGSGDHGPEEKVVGGLERSVNFTAKIIVPALKFARDLGQAREASWVNAQIPAAAALAL